MHLSFLVEPLQELINTLQTPLEIKRAKQCGRTWIIYTWVVRNVLSSQQAVLLRTSHSAVCCGFDFKGCHFPNQPYISLAGSQIFILGGGLGTDLCKGSRFYCHIDGGCYM